MIDHPYKDIYNRETADKKFIITVMMPPNSIDPSVKTPAPECEPIDELLIYWSDIVQGSFKIHERLCSEDNLTYGICSCNYIEFDINNNEDFINYFSGDETINPYGIRSFYGLTLKLEQVLNDDFNNRFCYGYYLVREDSVSNDKTNRSLVAYDQMIMFMEKDIIDWYNQSTFPMTIRQLWENICYETGVAYEYDEGGALYFGEKKVYKYKGFGDSLSAHTLLEYVCEMNLVFGKFDRNGYFEFKMLKGFNQAEGPHTLEEFSPVDNSDKGHYEILLDRHKLVDDSFVYADYISKHVEQLKIFDYENKIVYTSQTKDKDNIYIIAGNPVLLENRKKAEIKEIGEWISAFISWIWYIPATFEITGNPCYEVGDRVKIQYDNYAIYTYIFNRDIDGEEYLHDQISCLGSEVYPQSFTGISSTASSYNSYDTSVSKLAFIRYTNKFAYNLNANADPTPVIKMNVVTIEETDLLFIGTIILETKSTATQEKSYSAVINNESTSLKLIENKPVSVKATYKWKGIDQKYYPYETYDEEGTHTLNLAFLISEVPANTVEVFEVDLQAINGTIKIKKADARGYILLQGAAMEDSWTGIVEIKETIGEFMPSKWDFTVGPLIDSTSIESIKVPITGPQINQNVGIFRPSKWDFTIVGGITEEIETGYVIVSATRSIDNLNEWIYDPIYINIGSHSFTLRNIYNYESHAEEIDEGYLEVINISLENFASVISINYTEVEDE